MAFEWSVTRVEAVATGKAWVCKAKEERWQIVDQKMRLARRKEPHLLLGAEEPQGG